MLKNISGFFMPFFNVTKFLPTPDYFLTKSFPTLDIYKET